LHLYVFFGLEWLHWHPSKFNFKKGSASVALTGVFQRNQLLHAVSSILVACLFEAIHIATTSLGLHDSVVFCDRNNLNQQSLVNPVGSSPGNTPGNTPSNPPGNSPSNPSSNSPSNGPLNLVGSTSPGVSFSSSLTSLFKL
jgi:hypothetical protein